MNQNITNDDLFSNYKIFKISLSNTNSIIRKILMIATTNEKRKKNKLMHDMITHDDKT